jgi:hypothetical protein
MDEENRIWREMVEELEPDDDDAVAPEAPPTDA